jgi:Arc/MetJ-type ribon-helix-helix transcriptional regulator
MTTINISLPDKLKDRVDEAVRSGYYASVSDLMRDGARQVLSQNDLAEDISQSQREFKTGKGRVLKSLKDLR